MLGRPILILKVGKRLGISNYNEIGLQGTMLEIRTHDFYYLV